MKRTAEVQRDAKIGEAEAKKDSGIKVNALWPVRSFAYANHRHVGDACMEWCWIYQPIKWLSMRFSKI